MSTMPLLDAPTVRRKRRRSLPAAAFTVAALSASVLLAGCTPGENAAKAAASQIGKPYVYGAESPRTGFDCSGLTMWAWQQAGKQLPRSAAAQYSATYPISASQLRPGDLAFWQESGRISHVAMYVGHGMIVQARNSSYPVEVDRLGWWADHFAGYRRVP